jgi:GDPmannose 4,6-dehydratase
MKIAFITGITGQDGSYLAELLLSKSYKVYGILRRHSTTASTKRIDHIFNKIHLMHGDMTDQTSLHNCFHQIFVENVDFDVLEVYNLAAQSHVKVSFEVPEYTGNVDALGTLRLLETILKSGKKDKIRFYQASTSELYGEVLETPQTEKTPFNPQSPYAVAKLYSFYIVENYRKSYGLFACNGILFNHTSPRRGETFVCKKICDSVARIEKGHQSCLTLGNLYSKRDIGHAKDYVYGMWLMLQRDNPSDYVLSTGVTYSIKEYVEMAWNVFGKKVEWHGTGVDEIGIVEGEPRVKIDKKYFRPAEVEFLLGDSSKAQAELNWSPLYLTKEIISEMVLDTYNSTI